MWVDASCVFKLFLMFAFGIPMYFLFDAEN